MQLQTFAHQSDNAGQSRSRKYKGKVNITKFLRFPITYLSHKPSSSTAVKSRHTVFTTEELQRTVVDIVL